MKQVRIRSEEGIFALVDDDDFEIVNKFKWYKSSRNRNYAYAITIIDGKTVKMHRLVMGLKRGDERIIDHINHNTLDNRKENLRITDKLNNSHNLKKFRNNKSGYTGVYKYTLDMGDRYRAMIRYAGKAFLLGTFDTAEEAARIYDIQQIVICGFEYAVTNFPVSNYSEEDLVKFINPKLIKHFEDLENRKQSRERGIEMLSW